MNDEIDRQVDYREMYFRMVRVTAKAIDMLVAAQQACEEDYVAAVDREMGYDEDETVRRWRARAMGDEEQIDGENWSCYLD